MTQINNHHSNLGIQKNNNIKYIRTTYILMSSSFLISPFLKQMTIIWNQKNPGVCERDDKLNICNLKLFLILFSINSPSFLSQRFSQLKLWVCVGVCVWKREILWFYDKTKSQNMVKNQYFLIQSWMHWMLRHKMVSNE